MQLVYLAEELLEQLAALRTDTRLQLIHDGHKTSINVEPEFWDQLRLITLGAPDYHG
jgi:predicted DNA-binding ribbon-helix-helix protein